MSKYKKRRLKLKRHDHPSARRMGRMVVGGKMLPKPRKALKVDSIATYHGRPWRVGMIGWTGGERYYWLVRAGGEVAMVPAFLVEPTAP